MATTSVRLTSLLLASVTCGLGCGVADPGASTEPSSEADTSESDSAGETETGETGETETGDEPEPVAVERGLLMWVYADEVHRYFVHEISEPEASPLVWSFEAGEQGATIQRSHFGSYYLGRVEEAVTEELYLTDEGFVDIRPLLPPGVPPTLWSVPTHGPNDDVALAQLGTLDALELYELRFDSAGLVLSARQLFEPPPPDVGGSYYIGHIRVSETHAVFTLEYASDVGEDLPNEVLGVWGLPLDGSSAPEQLVALDVQLSAPYVLELVGDQLVYADDPDLDGDLDLYTKPVDDPDAPAREICPGPDGSVPDAKPSSVAGQLLCIRELPSSADLLHVDLLDVQAQGDIVGEQALGLAHTQVLDANRLVFMTRPHGGFGQTDKGWSLMLAERVDGVWQAAVQISEPLVNMDAGIYRTTHGMGGVFYGGVDGDASWLSWVDLSGPNIPPPVKLLEDIGSVGSIELPPTGTRLVVSSMGDSAQLTSLDLSDPQGSRVDLGALFPDGWQVRGGALIKDGSEIVIRVDGPGVLARMPIDGSRPPIQIGMQADEYSYVGELVPRN